MIDAVIFDFDGVVVDSDRLFIMVANLVGVKMGFGNVGDILAPKTVGRHEEYAISLMTKTFGSSFRVKTFYDLFLQFLTDYLAKQKVPITLGIFTLAKYLRKRGITTLSATFNSRGYGEQFMRLGNLFGVFDHVLFGDTEGFNDTNMYESVCKIHGLTPKNTLVFEDSPNGVARAEAAKHPIILLPGPVPFSSTPRLVAKIDSLFDAIPILDRIIMQK